MNSTKEQELTTRIVFLEGDNSRLRGKVHDLELEIAQLRAQVAEAVPQEVLSAIKEIVDEWGDLNDAEHEAWIMKWIVLEWLDTQRRTQPGGE